MTLKTRYIIKYLLFRGLPFITAAFVLEVAVWYAVKTTGTDAELVMCTVIGFAVMVCIGGYFIINVCRFSRMIALQTARYGAEFSDKGAVTLAKIERWVILADQWVILPGRIALHRRHVIGTSVHTAHDRHIICHDVRLKTHDKKEYRIRFRKEKDARKVRNWAA